MVAESCGRGCAERSEAQHSTTLAANSKTGAEEGDADALLKRERETVRERAKERETVR